MENLHTLPNHMKKKTWVLTCSSVWVLCFLSAPFWWNDIKQLTQYFSAHSTHTYSHKINRVILSHTRINYIYIWWTDNLPVAIYCRWRQTVKVRHLPTCLAQEQDTLIYKLEPIVCECRLLGQQGKYMLEGHTSSIRNNLSPAQLLLN